MNCPDDILPPGDRIRKAITWLSEACLDYPEKKRRELLEQAEIRFNLTPRECEFLNRNFGDERPEKCQ
jgi:hypothetical protein